MGNNKTDTTVASTIPIEARESLQKLANWEGVSLSRYLAGILVEAARSGGDEIRTRSVRTAQQHGSSFRVNLPIEIAEHMKLKRGTPIAFAPTRGGVLIKTIS